MKNKERKNELIILISILVMLIIAIVTFSCKIYAFIAQPQEQEDNVLVEESNSNDSNITTVVITEEVEEPEQPEEIIVEENNKTNTTTKKSTTKNLPVLTAPNGETYSKIAKINIPSLGIKNDILSHTTTALMKISVTKYWGPEPNEPGNFCVIGHNYRNTRFFSKLKNIKKGAVVQITDSTGRTLEYKVYDMYVVDPSDSTCTSQLNDGHTDITLITCTDNSQQRFIVKARAN